MKISHTLPAAFGLVAAGQHAFSVHNDLLAYPQYSVFFSDSFIPAAEARKRLEEQEQRSQVTDEAKDTDISTKTDGTTTSHATSPNSYERMLLKDKPYLCTIPYVAPYVSTTNSSSEQSYEEQQNELKRATDSGVELLRGMHECIYYNAGWWVYSFCYGQGIRQFHRLPPSADVPAFPPREDPNVLPFTLGKFSEPLDKAGNKHVPDEVNSTPRQQQQQEQKPLKGAEGPDSSSASKQVSLELKTRGDSNYLVQRLGGGTICDLTGKPRTITVQFHCNQGMYDHIHSIKEMATCVYLMEIHTPRLCDDVAFMPPQYDRVNAIACQEIVERPKEKEWRSAFAARAKETLTGKVKSKGELLAAPVVIGGVELGGQKLVGGDAARTIKPSNIVKPASQLQQELVGKGKYIATIAQSDGSMKSIMDRREIKKLGVDTKQKDINDYIDQLEEWAGDGNPWRLELVELNGKFSFRGIRGDEDEDEEEEADAAAAEETARGDAAKGNKGSKEEYKGS